MRKILISFLGDTINFKYKVDKTKEEKDLTKTLMNTNVISNDELLFSDSYLKNNVSIMTSFLSEIIKSKNTSRLVVEDMDIVLIALDLIKDVKWIKHLYIVPDVSINYKIYDKLIKCQYLNLVNCFDIPSFMLEKLCTNGVVVDLRCDIVSISNFVYQNNLINYTKLYYRKTIKIFDKFNKDDIDDFETFCQINRNLKTIYVYDFDFDMIQGIYHILAKSHKKNIRIVIQQNLNNSNIINDNIKRLRLINKALAKDCCSKIQINYSMDYISKNFIKQLSITNIKTCLAIIVVLEMVVFASIKINNYKTNECIDEISNVSNTFNDYDDMNTSEVDDANNAEIGLITPYNTLYNQGFDELLRINSNTKAWLSINNTSINYPVVQYSDNDFYLNHDLNNDFNHNGWIFIDYRNDMNVLDKNTIIYGHNAKGSIMFATLKYVLKDSWNNDSNNLLITFNTPSRSMTAQIFSAYVIDNTNDYLYINFNDDDYQKFIDLIKGRSIKDFGVDFSVNDKMITLSTCSDNDKRLVVHAKIIQ